MATRKSTRREAKPSGPVVPVLSIDPMSLQDFQAAGRSLGRALTILRSAHAELQAQRNERLEGVDSWSHHALIRQGWESLDSAATHLYQIAPGDPVADETASPVLDELYRMMDVVRLAIHATRGDDLPDGGGATENPVRGALWVAIERVEALQQRISAFTANVRTATIPGYAPKVAA